MSRTRHRSASRTLAVTDELDLATTPVLRRAVTELLAGRPQTLVLDLSRCPFAGVDAVHALVDLTAAARAQGTTLLLVGSRPILRRAVAVVGQDDALRFAPAPRDGHHDT